MRFRKIVANLYEVKRRDGVWARVEKRRHDAERVVQAALQSPTNVRVLGPVAGRVLWVGREFKNADFFGIDQKWGLVFVETKVSSQQSHLALQMARRAQEFTGQRYRRVDEAIWKYISGSRPDRLLMSAGSRLRRLYAKGRLNGSDDVAAALGRRMRAPRPARVSRVLFIAVTPLLGAVFAERMERIRSNIRRRLSKRRGVFKVSAVLLTPHLHRGIIGVARIDF